jgi:hypothetical protein
MPMSLGPTIQALEIKTQETKSFPDGEIASEAEPMRSTRRSQLRSRLARIHFAFCCSRGPRHVSSDRGVIWSTY